MAGNATLDSTPGIAFRAHQYVKNIETGNLGYYYSKSLENLNYLIVDCVAKPVINRAPEWTYNNRVVDSIKTHRTLSLAIAGTIAVALFIYVVYLLHPKKGDSAPKTPEIDPKAGGTPDSAAPGPDGATGKKADGAEDAPKDSNGADHEEKPELNGGAPVKPVEKKDAEKKAGGSPEKPKEAPESSNPIGTDTTKAKAPHDDEPSSSEDAVDTSKGDDKKKRKASDPAKPLSSTPLVEEKEATEEFDFGAMKIEQLDSRTGSPASLPPPGEKRILDTLEENAAPGAPAADSPKASKKSSAAAPTDAPVVNPADLDASLAELENPPVSGSMADVKQTSPNPADEKK